MVYQSGKQFHEERDSFFKKAIKMCIAIPVMLCLTGCGDEFGIKQAELEDSSFELVTDWEIPSREYSIISKYTLPEEINGEIYQFVNAKETTSAHNVAFVSTEEKEDDIQIEWYGIKNLGEKADYTKKGLLLSDNNDDYRLYVKSISYKEDTKDKVLNYSQDKWLSMIKGTLPYLEDGYYERTEEDDTLKVVYAVENKEWKGFVNFFYDFGRETAHWFLYSERPEKYDEDRALATISSLHLVDNEIEQVSNNIRIELGENRKMYVADYLEGSPFYLAQCVWDTSDVDFDRLGKGTMLLKYGQTDYSIEIEIEDTTAPEVSSHVESKYWLETSLTLEQATEYCVTSDYSQPITIAFREEADSIILTEDMVNNRGNAEIPLLVTDGVGNVAQHTLNVPIVDEEALPEWYHLFYKQAENDEEVIYFKEIMTWGTIEDYFYSFVETEKYRSFFEESVSGFHKATDLGMEIDTHVSWYGPGLVAFYRGLDRIPENVLQEYTEVNGTIAINADNLQKKYNEPMEVAGRYTYDKWNIELTSLYANFGTDGIIIHELGHFVDDRCGEVSKKQTLNDLYVSEKQVFDDSYKNSVSQEVMEQNYANGEGYREYSFTNKKEFFADSFYLYCVNSDKIKELYPEVYEYMDECVKSLQ